MGQHLKCGPFEHGDHEQCYAAILAQLDELAHVAAPSRSTPAHDLELLRQAWDHGVRIAASYGDNIGHLQGSQADCAFRGFLDSLHIGSEGDVHAPPPPICADDAHSFGPCKTCGMPYLASRLEPPTTADIAWAVRVIHEQYHQGPFSLCAMPSCAVLAAASPPVAAEARDRKRRVGPCEKLDTGKTLGYMHRWSADRCQCGALPPFVDRVISNVPVAPAAPRDEKET